ERRCLADTELAPHHDGPHQLTGPERQHVVGHVAHDDNREELAHGHRAERTHQHPPPHGTQPDAGEIQGQRRYRPPQIRLTQRVQDLAEVLPAKGEVEKDETNANPDPCAPGSHERYLPVSSMADAPGWAL